MLGRSESGTVIMRRMCVCVCVCVCGNVEVWCGWRKEGEGCSK